MAEPLKNMFGSDVPVRIGESISAIAPDFDQDRFLTLALDGFDDLELTPRARHIADALADTLPSDRKRALEILIASLGPEIEGQELTGMDGFLYLPVVFFIADHGLDHFETAMTAQYEVTKRFTAEFSIRSFIDRYPQKTMSVLGEWALDPNVWCQRAPDRACLGPPGSTGSWTTRQMSSHCSRFSKTTRRSTSGDRSPTTSTTSRKTIRNSWWP